MSQDGRALKFPWDLLDGLMLKLRWSEKNSMCRSITNQRITTVDVVRCCFPRQQSESVAIAKPLAVTRYRLDVSILTQLEMPIGPRSHRDLFSLPIQAVRSYGCSWLFQNEDCARASPFACPNSLIYTRLVLGTDYLTM